MGWVRAREAPNLCPASFCPSHRRSKICSLVQSSSPSTRRKTLKWIALFLLLTKCACAQNVTAFVNVTLVPMNRPVLLKHQTVFVSGDRITRIVPARLASVPANVQSIDGRGKFLMPGLADMHAHFIREALREAAVQKPAASHGPELPASASADHERENRAFGMLFLANGVTTVRNSWGSPTIDAFSAEIRSGTAA